MIEIRIDPLSNQVVIINEDRARREDEFKPETLKETSCVFCPGNEALTPPEISRVSSGKNWTIRVIPNKFPILSLQKFKELSRGLFKSYKGHGNGEVVVLTPKHTESVTSFDTKKWFEVLKVYKERFAYNATPEDIEYVIIYHNEGSMAGASIRHSHSQVLAMPFVPKVIKTEAEKCAKKVCCEMVKKELKSNRLVFKNDNVIIFANYASRFPYETHIYSLKHIKSLVDFKEDTLYSLAEALSVLMKAYAKMFKGFQFNMVLHNSPLKSDYHFHIEIYPMLNKYAGLEYGTDIVVNDVAPESAGQKLRGAIKG